METKLNYPYLKSYCKNVAEKLVKEKFIQQKSLDGAQILEFSKVRQVNLFVIKVLFQKWKDEMNRLRSPYFNYNHPEVKDALKLLMNTLSRHISVEKGDFENLLEEALLLTILLIFSPYDYYRLELAEGKRVNDLKETTKFVKINQNILNSLIRELESRKVETISGSEGVEVLNQVIEHTNEQPEDFETYHLEINQWEFLDLDKLYSNQPETIVAGKKYTEQEEAVKPTQIPDFKPTLNDKFVREDKPTLADNFQRQKIENIRKYISINQRFMFVNELFGGSNEEYNMALDQLEALGSYDAAVNFLQNQYVPRYSWDLETEEVQEFFLILQKRY
jgi:hypothetical protein